MLFCRYNDPSYVKLEKLEIMVKLASAQNIDQVCAPCSSLQLQQGLFLSAVPSQALQDLPTTKLIRFAIALEQVLMELKEYASEVDVEFVRKVGLYLRFHTTLLVSLSEGQNGGSECWPPELQQPLHATAWLSSGHTRLCKGCAVRSGVGS